MGPHDWDEEAVETRLNSDPETYGYLWVHPIPLINNWLFWKQTLTKLLVALIILDLFILIMAFLSGHGNGVIFILAGSLLVAAVLLAYIIICAFIRQFLGGGQSGKFHIDRGGVGQETGHVTFLDGPMPLFGGCSSTKWKTVRQVTVYGEKGVIDFKCKGLLPRVTVYCEPWEVSKMVEFISDCVDPGIIEYA